MMWLEHGGLSQDPCSKVGKRRRQSKAARGTVVGESLQGSSFVLPFKLLTAMFNSLSVCSWAFHSKEMDTWLWTDRHHINSFQSSIPVMWFPHYRDNLSKSPLPLDVIKPRTSLWHVNFLGTRSYSERSFLLHYLHLVFLAMPWSRVS